LDKLEKIVKEAGDKTSKLLTKLDQRQKNASYQKNKDIEKSRARTRRLLRLEVGLQERIQGLQAQRRSDLAILQAQLEGLKSREKQATASANERRASMSAKFLKEYVSRLSRIKHDFTEFLHSNTAWSSDQDKIKVFRDEEERAEKLLGEIDKQEAGAMKLQIFFDFRETVHELEHLLRGLKDSQLSGRIDDVEKQQRETSAKLERLLDEL
jgi:hypothetical protein